MALLSFLTRDKIKNENTSKPFHKNTSQDERLDWFRRTRPWHKLNSRIVDALIEKFDNNPLFEVFVVRSMENGLVEVYEKQLSSRSAESSLIFTATISHILSSIGGEAAEKMSRLVVSGSKTGALDTSGLRTLSTIAIDFLDVAIFLEKTNLNAYLQIAGAYSSIGNEEKAKAYVEKGLSVILSLKELPFEKSSLAGIASSRADLDRYEKLLLLVRSQFN
jgi:hypothetical protein